MGGEVGSGCGAGPEDIEEPDADEIIPPEGVGIHRGWCAVSYTPEGTNLCFVWHDGGSVCVFLGPGTEAYASFRTEVSCPLRPPFGEAVAGFRAACEQWMRFEAKTEGMTENRRSEDDESRSHP